MNPHLLLVLSIPFIFGISSIESSNSVQPPIDGNYQYLKFVRAGGGQKVFTVRPTVSSYTFQVDVTQYSFHDTSVTFLISPDTANSSIFQVLNEALHGGIQINGTFRQPTLPTGTWSYFYLINGTIQVEITNKALREKLAGFENLVESKMITTNINFQVVANGTNAGIASCGNNHVIESESAFSAFCDSIDLKPQLLSYIPNYDSVQIIGIVYQQSTIQALHSISNINDGDTIWIEITYSIPSIPDGLIPQPGYKYQIVAIPKQSNPIAFRTVKGAATAVTRRSQRPAAQNVRVTTTNGSAPVSITCGNAVQSLRMVRVYTLGGQLVREIAGQAVSVLWDGRDISGRSVPAGTYMLEIADASGAMIVQKLSLAR